MASDNLVRLAANVQSFQDKLADVVQAFAAFAESVAMSSLDTAERWVAGQPRRHYADPELTEPAGTEGDRG